jgi:hypothetical protein
MSIATLLQIFGPNLDIVYPRANQTIESIGYKNIIYWNDTRLIPDPPAMPPQSAAGNESAWQLHTPAPQSNEPNLLGIYATGISVGAVVAVFVSVIEFRKKRK